MSLNDDEEEVLKKNISVLGEGNISNTSVAVSSNLEFEKMKIDLHRRIVERDGEDIYLTYTEYEILYLLARNPGRVFSREQIYSMIWKEECIGDSNIIMSHIRK